MNDQKIAKLQSIARDEAALEVVFDVFKSIFQKKSRDRDVQSLASRFMALELLAEAEAEFEKYKGQETGKAPKGRQVGL